MNTEGSQEERAAEGLKDRLKARRRAFPHDGYAALLREILLIAGILAIGLVYGLYQSGLL